MRTISQRELRNDNAAVVRGVEAGETYLVTRRGVPVAQLGPVPEPGAVPTRAASRSVVFSELVRVSAQDDTETVLDDLRGDR